MDLRTLLVLVLPACPFSFLKASDLKMRTMTSPNGDISYSASVDAAKNISLKSPEASLTLESHRNPSVTVSIPSASN